MGFGSISDEKFYKSHKLEFPSDVEEMGGLEGGEGSGI